MKLLDKFLKKKSIIVVDKKTYINTDLRDTKKIEEDVPKVVFKGEEKYSSNSQTDILINKINKNDYPSFGYPYLEDDYYKSLGRGGFYDRHVNRYSSVIQGLIEKQNFYEKVQLNARVKKSREYSSTSTEKTIKMLGESQERLQRVIHDQENRLRQLGLSDYEINKIKRNHLKSKSEQSILRD